jgi:hypothetical protein
MVTLGDGPTLCGQKVKFRLFQNLVIFLSKRQIMDPALSLAIIQVHNSKKSKMELKQLSLFTDSLKKMKTGPCSTFLLHQIVTPYMALKN